MPNLCVWGVLPVRLMQPLKIYKFSDFGKYYLQAGISGKG